MIGQLCQSWALVCGGQGRDKKREIKKGSGGDRTKTWCELRAGGHDFCLHFKVRKGLAVDRESLD